MKDHFNKMKDIFSVKRRNIVRGEERLFKQRKRETSTRLRIKDEVVVIDLWKETHDEQIADKVVWLK